FYSFWPTRNVERALKLFIANPPWRGSGPIPDIVGSNARPHGGRGRRRGCGCAPALAAMQGASIRGMSSVESPRVNLALQGGGSHGAYTWGVLDRLLEDGRVDFEGLSGASAGAVNAALFAHGWLEEGRDGARAALSGFWHSVGAASGVFGSAPPGPWVAFFTRTMSPYQFNPANLNPLRSLLASQIDFERLRASTELRLFVSATNVRTNHARVFHGQEISVDAVMASACLPSVFQAVEIEGEAYWD